MESYERTVRGEVEPYEYRFFDSDGSIHWVRTSSRLIMKDGVAAGITGVMTDITPRKEAEARMHAAIEALRKNERDLRLITDNMRDTVWLMDMELKATWISPSVLRTRGFTLEDLAGMPLERHVTPDSLHKALAMIEEHLSPEKLADPACEVVASAELEFYRKDGSTIWTDVVVTLLRDQDGKPDGFLGVGRDISERMKMEKSIRESESMLGFLAENIADIIWILDLNLNTTYVSPSIEKILGFTVEERKKQSQDMMMTRDSMNRCFELLGAELARDGQEGVDPDRVSRIEVEYYRADGSTIWMENSSTAVRDELGRITGICGVSHDITERKRAADELREKEEALARSLDEKNALLRELQHRVKNSLVMIAGLIGIERARTADPEARSVLEGLRGRVDSVARLYALLFQTGDVRRLMLDEYMHRIVQSLEETYVTHMGRIRLELEFGKVPLDVKQAAPFGLILNELVTNALKYAFPGERRGTLWVTLAVEAGGIILVVADDGVGPPPEFDPNAGAGFGLQLVKMLVGQLGGEFVFERAERTVCTVRVPSEGV